MIENAPSRRSPSSRTVLYVDDDPVDVESVVRAIERRGLPFELRSAPDLATGRRVLEEASIALVLADLRLGDGDGIDMLRAAPGVPTIILTGEGSEAQAAEALRGGAADYVVKQADGRHLDALLGSMVAALARHEAERARAQAAEELARSYRELETLSGTLDEALSVPLVRIQELSERLSEHLGEEDPTGQAVVSEVAQRAALALDVVTRVVRLAALNPKAEQPCRVEFSDLVRRAVRRVALDWSNRVEVMIDSTCALNVRPAQLQLAIESVLEHAARHWQAGGPPVPILASAEYDDDWAELRFVDAGLALDAVDLDRVLSIQSVGEPQPGTGLAIFERVARIHDGWAWVEGTAEGHLCLCQRIPRDGG